MWFYDCGGYPSLKDMLIRWLLIKEEPVVVWKEGNGETNNYYVNKEYGQWYPKDDLQAYFFCSSFVLRFVISVDVDWVNEKGRMKNRSNQNWDDKRNEIPLFIIYSIDYF